MRVTITKQLMDEVSSLWRAGVSASQISTRFEGMTRQRVIDLVNRAGIGQTKFSVALATTDDEELDDPPSFQCEDVTEEQEPRGVLFIEAAGSTRHCKFPLWDDLDKVSIYDKRVCGEKPLLGSSWCQHHFERFFRRAKKTH